MRAHRKSPSPKPCCGLYTPPLTVSPLPSLTAFPNQVLRSTCLTPPPGLPCTPHGAPGRPLPDTLHPPQEGTQPLAQSMHVGKARGHRASLRWSTPHRGVPSTLAMDCDIERLQSPFPLCCRVLPPNPFHEITPGPGTPAAFLQKSPPSVPKDTKSSRAPTTGSRASGNLCFPPGLGTAAVPNKQTPGLGPAQTMGPAAQGPRVTGEALRP